MSERKDSEVAHCKKSSTRRRIGRREQGIEKENEDCAKDFDVVPRTRAAGKSLWWGIRRKSRGRESTGRIPR